MLSLMTSERPVLQGSIIQIGNLGTVKLEGIIASTLEEIPLQCNSAFPNADCEVVYHMELSIASMEFTMYIN